MGGGEKRKCTFLFVFVGEIKLEEDRKGSECKDNGAE